MYAHERWGWGTPPHVTRAMGHAEPGAAVNITVC